ncbi:MAG: hypothetical protein WC679_07690 [Bacteroidales bacterium]
MKILFKVHYFNIVIASTVLIFCSLTTNGQNFAKEFVNKQNDSISQDVVYLYINPTISYRNESIEKMPNFDSLDEDIQDKLFKKYAPLQDSINDSILFTKYRQQLINTFYALGIKVIYTNPENFPSKIDETHHTLNVAQLEIEEFTTPDSLVYEENSSIVFQKQLNGVRFSAWLIYDESDTNSRLVFYNDQETTDFFEGEIIKQGQDYTASYDYKKLTTKDAYQTAGEAGVTSAKYFFNFLLNKYVWIQSSGNVNYYYGIDPQTRTISSDIEPFDNFDLIDYK